MGFLLPGYVISSKNTTFYLNFSSPPPPENVLGIKKQPINRTLVPDIQCFR